MVRGVEAGRRNYNTALLLTLPAENSQGLLGREHKLTATCPIGSTRNKKNKTMPMSLTTYPKVKPFGPSQPSGRLCSSGSTLFTTQGLGPYWEHLLGSNRRHLTGTRVIAPSTAVLLLPPSPFLFTVQLTTNWDWK